MENSVKEDPTKAAIQRVLNKPSSRREFLGHAKKAALLVAGAGFAGGAGLLSPPPKETKASSSPKSQPLTAGSENSSRQEALSDMELLSQIVTSALDSQSRKQAEETYFSRVVTLEQIDKGLWVINYYKNDADNHKQLRAELLAKRYELRKKGTPELTSLTPDLIAWAEEQGIHPEVIGICLDAYKKARNIIQKFIVKSLQEFRPDFYDQTRQNLLPPATIKGLVADQLMMNVGGMARLLCTETGLDFNSGSGTATYAFVNIGDKPAETQINESVFADAQSALTSLCKLLAKDTGLSFTPSNIPGSSWTAGNSSGGAIGPQFMPGEALKIYNLMESVGEKFNPFDPQSAVVGAWIFLARSQYLAGTGYREGYMRGLLPHQAQLRQYALLKWNPNYPQVQAILDSANDYSNRFA